MFTALREYAGWRWR